MRRLLPGRQATRTAEETAEIGRQVKSLLEHPGWEYFLEALDAKADAGLNLVVDPKETTHGQYADAIGYAKGLRDVQKVAEQVIKRGQKALDEAHELDVAGQATE
jgi:hypothetical protein